MPIQNGVMMQFFHWYSPADGTLWDEAASRAKELAAGGLHRRSGSRPPTRASAERATSVTGSTTCTTSGSSTRRAQSAPSTGRRSSTWRRSRRCRRPASRSTPTRCSTTASGGDSTEVVRATPFPQDDRLRPKREPREIEAYTHFSFPGRKGKHSKFEWHARHFDAVDYDHRDPGEKNTGRTCSRASSSTTRWRSRTGTSRTSWGRPRLREPGGAGRGHRLGQVVPRHHGGGRLPPRRGEALLGLVLPGVARRDGAPREQGPLHRRGVLDSRTSAHSTGTWTASAVASPSSGCPSTTTSTTRAGPAATATCDGSSTARSCTQRSRDVGDLRGEPRLAAAAGARVGGRALVQAARLRAHPPAPRGATRASSTPTTTGPEYEDRGTGRQPPPDRDAIAPVADRQVPARAEALRLGPAGRLPRPLEPRGLGPPRRRPAPRRPWRC